MPHLDEVEALEKKFDYAPLLKEALDNIEVEIISIDNDGETLL